MANSYYSNQEVHLETVFEDTKNVCLLSRVQLKDYNPTCDDYEEQEKQATQEMAYEELESENTDASKGHSKIRHHSDPDVPFEGEFADDIELMRSMGLPLNFGNQARRHRSTKHYYDKDYDYDANYYDGSEDFNNTCYDVFENQDANYYDGSEDYNDTSYVFENQNIDIGMDTEWENYWKLHGDSIVMHAWMQKYKEYINPDYFAFGENDKGEVEEKSHESTAKQITDTIETMQSEDVETQSETLPDIDTNIEGTEENVFLSEQFNGPDLPFRSGLKEQEYFLNMEKLKDILNDMTIKKPKYDNMFVHKAVAEAPLPSMPTTDDGWDELWVQHNRELYDHHYEIFKDTYSLQKTNTNEKEVPQQCEILVSCSNCKKLDCYFCFPEHEGDSALQFGDLDTSVPMTFERSFRDQNAISNEALLSDPNNLGSDIFDTLPIFDDCTLSGSSQGSAFKSVDNSETSDFNHQIEENDDGPPVELPIKIKRSLSSDEQESSDTPLDHVIDLGFQIQPAHLRINKMLKRKKLKGRKNKKCPFKMIVTPSSNIAEDKMECTSTDLKKACSEEVAIVTETKNEEPTDDKNQVFKKYWSQRYRLFSLFDKGIQLDEESWFSVTPEQIASHIAERCVCDIIVDAFCGAGGNSIQFAKLCYHVIAIDIDPAKIKMAKNNAKVYGVDQYIDFIVGDFFDLAPSLKADVVFLSPPWGGPKYLQNKEYDLSQIEPDIYKTFEISRKITSNIAVFVPRTTIINQLVQLAGDGNRVEIEQNAVNKKIKTITAYYGDLVQTEDESTCEIKQAY